MSSGIKEEEDKELDDLKDQIEQLAEEQPKAEETPSPEPVKETVVSETEVETPATEPEPAKADVQDNPMEWAKKKGYKNPEDMARALLQKERAFHESQQKAKEVQPPTPQWQPAPQIQQFPPQYLPPYQPNPGIRQIAANYPQIPVEDFERLFPVIVDAAEAISSRKVQAIENKYAFVERQTERNSELMALMQDPAFRDERVQKEIHTILDSDPSIFQREKTPLVYAFKEAIFNLGRKGLQQGANNGIETVKGNIPPVTAGGGNGSANITPRKFTERDIEKWTHEEIKAYMNSNGKVIPKKYQ